MSKKIDFELKESIVDLRSRLKREKDNRIDFEKIRVRIDKELYSSKNPLFSR